MRFIHEAESRPSGPEGNRDFHFSLNFEDGRMLVCLGGLPPEGSADAVRYFAVELEHYAQTRAREEWPESPPEAVILDLVSEADRLLRGLGDAGACRAGFFAALLQPGRMDYVAVGDAGAAVWDAAAYAAGDAEEFSGVRFLPPRDARPGPECLPLEGGRTPAVPDVKSAQLNAGSAAIFFTGGVWRGGGPADERDAARLSAAVGDAYAGSVGPARRLLDDMIEQWDRKGDFTGVVVEALPGEDRALESGEIENPAGPETERFLLAVRELAAKLEADMARIERNIESAAGESAVLQTDVAGEIKKAVEASRSMLRKELHGFEAGTRKSAAAFARIIRGLERERRGIEALERRIEAAVDHGLKKLGSRQAAGTGGQNERNRLLAGLILGLLALILIGVAGVGIYGYSVYNEPRERVVQVPADGERARSERPGQARRSRGESGDIPGVVRLDVSGSSAGLPVPRDVPGADFSDGDSISMDRAYELVLEALRRGAYDKRAARDVISFLLDARQMDAGRRLELLNFMAFDYLFTENAISDYEDRSWAVNVFVDRFPLERFDNPELSAGEPGVLEVRLDRETFDKLARWKKQGRAPRDEALPVILQFMFVYPGEGEGPQLIDGHWGPESKREWREYVERLRRKGLKGAGRWKNRDPLEPAQ